MAKNFVKNYIGKGKKNENFDIVEVTLDFEEAEKHVFQYEGKKYLKFEVALLKSPDNYGKTHTVYVNKLEKEDENEEKGA